MNRTIIAGRDVITVTGNSTVLTGNTMSQTPIVSHEIQGEIIRLLYDMNLETVNARRAFVIMMNPDQPFINCVSFGGSVHIFVSLFVSACLSYGRFDRGTPAIVALVETVQSYGGLEKRGATQGLLARLYDLYGIPIAEQQQHERELQHVTQHEEETFMNYLIKRVQLADIDSTALTFQVKKALRALTEVDVIEKDGETLLIVGGKQLVINEEFLKKLQTFALGKMVDITPVIENPRHQVTWEIIQRLGVFTTMEVELVQESIDDIFA